MHPYFTRQPYTVVQGHIAHFTQPGDTVLDPFGGTGVTAIEAMMLGRRAIHVDLNPLSAFMVGALTAPLDAAAFTEAHARIAAEYARLEPHTEAEVARALKRYPKPKPLPLTHDADVETADQLFSPRQTACLGLLKHLIMREEDASVRNALMLSFSALLAKINRTFHYDAKGVGGGDAAAFRYYRYRIAKESDELDPLHYFARRCQSLLRAKAEMAGHINAATISRLRVLRGSATALHDVPDESVDYIYTDPPYGNKIPYLDLSAMWEAWLDFETTDEDRALEAIQGGSRGKTFDDYRALMGQSLREMYRVLRYDRWLSFVFAHKDPALWHMILDEAEASGFEYRGSHVQPVGKVSFKKRQKPLTVINGQLVLHFVKGRNPQRLLRATLGTDVEARLNEAIECTIVQNHGATLEEINDAIIIRALEGGFLHLLTGQYGDLTPFLADRFDYDEDSLRYHLRPNTRLTAHIPLEDRLPYHLRSYLAHENAREHYPTSDEVVYTLIPLLRNGTTPSDQSVLGELQRAAHPHKGGWRLNENDSLF